MKWAVISAGCLAVLALILAETAGAALAMFPPLWPLLLAPTVFLYLAATWAVSAILPIKRVWLARSAALVIVVAAACLAVLPLRQSAIAQFEQRSEVPDIIPDQPIALSGDVRIEREWDYWDRPMPCDDLCLALLDLEGVTSVTLVEPSFTITYRLVPLEAADPAAVVEPIDPGGFSQWGGSGRESAVMEAYWQERLAGPVRLVSGPTPARADYTLVPSTPGVLQGDTIIARWVNVARGVPIIPPLLGMEFSGADLGFAPGGLTLVDEVREAGPFRPNPHPYAFFGQVLALKNYDGLPDPPREEDQSFASSP